MKKLSFGQQASSESEQNGRVFVCPSCNAQFDSFAKFNVHRKAPCKSPDESLGLRVIPPGNSKVSGGAASFTITVEDFYYGNKAGRRLKEKKTNKRMKCYSCSKVLHNNIRFMGHVRHKIENSWKRNDSVNDFNICSHCYRHYESPFHLQCHLETVHTAVPADSSCRICELNFENELMLLNHMRSEHHRNEMPYVCKLCNFRSSFHASLMLHFRQTHDNGNSLLCPFCLHVVNSSNAYLKHVLFHRKKKIRCTKCRLQFLSASDRNKHLSEDHVTISSPDNKKHQPKNIDECQVVINFPRPQTPKKERSSPALSKSPNVVLSASLPDHQSPSASNSNHLGGSTATVNDMIQFHNLGDLLRPIVKELTIYVRLTQDCNNSKCIECGQVLGFYAFNYNKHFRKEYKCRFCNFVSHCLSASVKHILKFHDNTKKELTKSPANTTNQKSPANTTNQQSPANTATGKSSSNNANRKSPVNSPTTVEVAPVPSKYAMLAPRKHTGKVKPSTPKLPQHTAPRKHTGKIVAKSTSRPHSPAKHSSRISARKRSIRSLSPNNNEEDKPPASRRPKLDINSMLEKATQMVSPDNYNILKLQENGTIKHSRKQSAPKKLDVNFDSIATGTSQTKESAYSTAGSSAVQAPSPILKGCSVEVDETKSEAKGRQALRQSRRRKNARKTTSPRAERLSEDDQSEESRNSRFTTALGLRPVKGGVFKKSTHPPSMFNPYIFSPLNKDKLPSSSTEDLKSVKKAAGKNLKSSEKTKTLPTTKPPPLKNTSPQAKKAEIEPKAVPKEPATLPTESPASPSVNSPATEPAVPSPVKDPASGKTASPKKPVRRKLSSPTPPKEHPVAEDLCFVTNNKGSVSLVPKKSRKSRPEEPKNLWFTDVTSSSFIVHWKAPKVPVSHYKLSFQGSGLPTTQELPSEQTSVRLVGLRSSTDYVVRVSALYANKQSLEITGKQMTLTLRQPNKTSKVIEVIDLSDDDDDDTDDEDCTLVDVTKPPEGDTSKFGVPTQEIDLLQKAPSDSLKKKVSVPGSTSIEMNAFDGDTDQKLNLHKIPVKSNINPIVLQQSPLPSGPSHLRPLAKRPLSSNEAVQLQRTKEAILSRVSISAKARSVGSLQSKQPVIGSPLGSKGKAPPLNLKRPLKQTGAKSSPKAQDKDPVLNAFLRLKDDILSKVLSNSLNKKEAKLNDKVSGEVTAVENDISSREEILPEATAVTKNKASQEETAVSRKKDLPGEKTTSEDKVHEKVPLPDENSLQKDKVQLEDNILTQEGNSLQDQVHFESEDSLTKDDHLLDERSKDDSFLSNGKNSTDGLDSPVNEDSLLESQPNSEELDLPANSDSHSPEKSLPVDVGSLVNKVSIPDEFNPPTNEQSLPMEIDPQTNEESLQMEVDSLSNEDSTQMEVDSLPIEESLPFDKSPPPGIDLTSDSDEVDISQFAPTSAGRQDLPEPPFSDVTNACLSPNNDAVVSEANSKDAPETFTGDLAHLISLTSVGDASDTDNESNLSCADKSLSEEIELPSIEKRTNLKHDVSLRIPAETSVGDDSADAQNLKVFSSPGGSVLGGLTAAGSRGSGLAKLPTDSIIINTGKVSAVSGATSSNSPSTIKGNNLQGATEKVNSLSAACTHSSTSHDTNSVGMKIQPQKDCAKPAIAKDSSRNTGVTENAAKTVAKSGQSAPVAEINPDESVPVEIIILDSEEPLSSMETIEKTLQSDFTDPSLSTADSLLAAEDFFNELDQRGSTVTTNSQQSLDESLRDLEQVLSLLSDSE